MLAGEAGPILHCGAGPPTKRLGQIKHNWRQACGDRQTVRAGMSGGDRVATRIQRDGQQRAISTDHQRLTKCHLAARDGACDGCDKHRQA